MALLNRQVALSGPLSNAQKHTRARADAQQRKLQSLSSGERCRHANRTRRPILSTNRTDFKGAGLRGAQEPACAAPQGRRAPRTVASAQNRPARNRFQIGLCYTAAIPSGGDRCVHRGLCGNRRFFQDFGSGDHALVSQHCFAVPEARVIGSVFPVPPRDGQKKGQKHGQSFSRIECRVLAQ